MYSNNQLNIILFYLYDILYIYQFNNNLLYLYDI